MTPVFILTIAMGFVAVGVALYTALFINKQDAGNERMREISENIASGAKAPKRSPCNR